MAVYESRSPYHPDDLVVAAPASDAEQVAEAVSVATRAAREWRATPAPARARALGDAASGLGAAADDLAELIVREVGKPVAEAEGEIARAVAIWRYNAEATLDPDGATYPSPDGRSLLYHRRRPHGVVGLITPWNFPVAIPSWKAAPALACANAVLLKPAPEAVGCAFRLAEVLSRSLPDGLLQVVSGDSEAGEAVVETVDAVSFTGSVAVGRSVATAAARRQIPCQAEMGGQNASLVLPDADLGATAASVAAAAMGFAGQKCTATSRVVVVGDPDPFVEALVAAVGALPVGDPAERATVVGPVIDERARREVLEAAEAAVGRGCRLLTGGRSLEPGHVVTPILIDHAEPGDPIAREEVFGPLAVVLAARDVEEAVRIVNGVRYGLVTSVYTADLDLAISLPPQLETGLVKVNAPSTGVDFWAPFGGDKDSSYGPREQGKAAADFYTTTQTLTLSSPAGRR